MREPGENPEDLPIPRADRPINTRNLALTGLFSLALCFAIYHGRGLLAPVVVALFLRFLLIPLVRWLRALHVPAPLGAALVVAMTVAVLGGAIYGMASPVAAWLERAPRDLAELRELVDEWRPKLAELSRTANQLSDVTDGGDEPMQVELQGDDAVERAFRSTAPAALNFAMVIVLLFFLLASGDSMMNKLVRTAGGMSEKKRLVQMLRKIEIQVSSYLVTITLINICLGAAIALMCWLFGLPRPLLWGAMAALFNYVPYLGAIAGAAIVGGVSVANVGPELINLLPAVLYLLINGLEGYVITPMILGQSLALSPVAVFLSLLFWGWMWGLVGLVIAVPVLVAIKAGCARSERLESVAVFLGRG